jgi:hypothetical protein
MLYWVYLGMNRIRTYNIIGDRPFDLEFSVRSLLIYGNSES